MNSFLIKKFFIFLSIIIAILLINWFFNQIKTEILLKKLVSYDIKLNETNIISLEEQNRNLLNIYIQQLNLDPNSKFSLKNSTKTSNSFDEKVTKNIFPININKATLDQLCLIPGIGAVLAQRIIDYRNSNGPIKTSEDLLKVKGIGEKKLQTILKYIVF